MKFPTSKKKKHHLSLVTTSRPRRDSNIVASCQAVAPPEAQKDKWLLCASERHRPREQVCSVRPAPARSLRLSIISVWCRHTWGRMGLESRSIIQTLVTCAVPINVKWAGVWGLSLVTRLCWLFTVRLALGGAVRTGSLCGVSSHPQYDGNRRERHHDCRPVA